MEKFHSTKPDFLTSLNLVPNEDHEVNIESDLAEAICDEVGAVRRGRQTINMRGG